MGFRVTSSLTDDWVQIARMASADPFLNIWHPGTLELEVESVDQATLDTAFTAYKADQANIDAATAQAQTVRQRNQAEIAPDGEGSGGMSARALIEVFNKRDNFLTNRILQLQTALEDMKASTGAADSIRAAIPATFLPTSTRPRNDAIQDYKDEITSGDADN